MDEESEHAATHTRRGTLWKMGAAGVAGWVAPQILSTSAAAAATVGPVAGPAYLQASRDPSFLYESVPGGDSFPWDRSPIVSGIVETVGSSAIVGFEILTAGVYRVGFSVACHDEGKASLFVNGALPPGRPTLLLRQWRGTGPDGYCENLVQLTTGDAISIVNTSDPRAIYPGGTTTVIDSVQHWIVVQQIA